MDALILFVICALVVIPVAAASFDEKQPDYFKEFKEDYFDVKRN